VLEGRRQAVDLGLGQAVTAGHLAPGRHRLPDLGLGERFLRRVEDATAFMQEYPRGAPIMQGAARGKVVSRFPYTVLYSIEERGIYVLAVAHHKRRPGYWRSRLADR
jgi:hypothetical protein